MVAVVTSVQRLIRRKKKERSIRWINGRVLSTSRVNRLNLRIEYFDTFLRFSFCPVIKKIKRNFCKTELIN